MEYFIGFVLACGLINGLFFKRQPTIYFGKNKKIHDHYIFFIDT